MNSDPAIRLEQAKQGTGSDVGRLLSHYVNYLKFIAQSQLDHRVRRRVSPSDLVQDTLLEAHRDFAGFRGSSEFELIAWLRKILINNLIRAAKQHLKAEKRDVRREISLQALAGNHSGSRLEFELAGHVMSPGSAVHQQDRLMLLREALSRLPQDQLQVIVMRHIEGMPFSEIAEALNRSSGACRMLWMRGIEQLRNRLSGGDAE